MTAPPTAIPGNLWETTNSADCLSKSGYCPPWMMPNRAGDAERGRAAMHLVSQA